jgi:hypothetical protein
VPGPKRIRGRVTVAAVVVRGTPMPARMIPCSGRQATRDHGNRPACNR